MPCCITKGEPMTVDFRKQTCLLYAKEVADEMREMASTLEECSPMEEDLNKQAAIIEDAIDVIESWGKDWL